MMRIIELALTLTRPSQDGDREPAVQTVLQLRSVPAVPGARGELCRPQHPRTVRLRGRGTGTE